MKDFSENIVESLNVGVLAVDLEGRVEFWNTQMEGLTGIVRADAVNRPLAEVLPADLEAEIAVRADENRVSSLYKFHLQSAEGRNLLVNVSIARWQENRANGWGG